MTGVHGLVSPEFFDALMSHSKVKEAYERWQEGAALRDDMRSGFTFGGITFEEYRGQATDPDGNVRRFIASSEGHCFPVGTHLRLLLLILLRQVSMRQSTLLDYRFTQNKSRENLIEEPICIRNRIHCLCVCGRLF